jgi:hypothetical protein
MRQRLIFDQPPLREPPFREFQSREAPKGPSEAPQLRPPKLAAASTCLPDVDPPTLAADAHVPPQPLTGKWQNITDLLFNPLDPVAQMPHHPIITRFFAQYVGPVEREWMTDWLGIRTNFLHECSVRQLYPYTPYVISRRIQCLTHCFLLENQLPVAAGELPPLDDEYPQWIDVLASVVRTPALAHYVVVELGARIGTWGVRALAARRFLHGASAAGTFVAVESYDKYVSWMRPHLRANNVAEQTIVLDNDAGRRRGGPTLTLADIFREAKINHIDYLDLDIQGAEALVLRESKALRELLNENVTHIHIGTHSAAIHVELRDLFVTKLKWRKVMDLPHFGVSCDGGLVEAVQTRKDCWTQTNFGPINVRDGLLAFVNPQRAPPAAFYEPLIVQV